MELKVVRRGELDRIADLHPHLLAARPDLAAWPFALNPVQPAEDFPFLFYVLDGARIAGHRRCVPDTAWIDGNPLPWSWGFDSFVEPDYRGHRIGSRLVDLQVAEMDRLGIASGAAFSAPAMLRIYARLGFTVGRAPRLCLVRDAKPFLRARLGQGAALRVAGALANGLLAAERGLRGALDPAGRFAVEPIDDARFAEVFDRAAVRPTRGYWAGRASWILARRQAADTLHQVRRAGAHEPSALFVARDRGLEQGGRAEDRRHGRRITLMEFALLDDRADTPRLVAAALARLLVAASADMADVVTSSPPLLAALAARGYRRRGEGMTFSYKLPPGSRADPRLAPADWHLTHFCSDGFLFD